MMTPMIGVTTSRHITKTPNITVASNLDTRGNSHNITMKTTIMGSQNKDNLTTQWAEVSSPTTEEPPPK